MAQLFLSETFEIMLKKEFEFPRELGFVKGQPAGNRIQLLSSLSCLLNSGYEFDCGFFVMFAFFIRSSFVVAHQLPVAEVLQQYDSTRAIDGINFRHRNLGRFEKPGGIQIRMKLRIEGLGIYRGNSGPSLPRDTEIAAGGSIRS